MMTVSEGWGLWVFGVVFGFALGATVTSWGWEEDIVGRGLALYCPQDGDWAWNGECDK